MKVLHLPTSVGGNSWGLAQAEKKMGLDSTVLVDSENWLGYDYDICLHLENKNKIDNVLTKIKTFFKIRSEYDVYHFNFGSSLVDFQNYGVHLWDLPFYQGKKIMTYNGCDARQKYLTMQRVEFSACHEKKCYGGICNSGIKDKIRSKRIKKVHQNVDHIFSLNPDLMHVLPQDKTTFLPYTIAGWDSISALEYQINNTIKIVHSPTNRVAKGSAYILSALENLQQKYKNIEIIVIENLPYEQALQKYREAHIVIDQVLIGWYGAFGVEVMKMGKPLGVFIRDEDLHFIPKDMKKDLLDAVINITPYSIEKELAKYIENTELLYKKSQAAIDYVNKWHNPNYVAQIAKNAYKD